MQYLEVRYNVQKKEIEFKPPRIWDPMGESQMKRVLLEKGT